MYHSCFFNACLCEEAQSNNTSLELNEPEAVLLRRDGVLQRPPSVVLLLHHGQRHLPLRGRRAVPPGRDAPVVAPESRGQGQLQALLQGGPAQTEVW